MNGKSGLKPSSLRDALEDALVEANVNHKIKECLMGHHGSIEMEYGGQNRLVIVVVEAMKKAYPLLSLNGLTRERIVETKKLETEIEGLKASLSAAIASIATLKKLQGLPLTDTERIIDEQTENK